MSEAAVGVDQVGVPDDEMGRRHKEGWTWAFSVLADCFASRPSDPTSIWRSRAVLLVRSGQAIPRNLTKVITSSR